MGTEDAIFGADGGSRDLSYRNTRGVGGEDGVGVGKRGEAGKYVEFEGNDFLRFTRGLVSLTFKGELYIEPRGSSYRNGLDHEVGF